MAIKLTKRLGDLLIEDGIVSEEDVAKALAQQRVTGRKLGDMLMDMGFLSEAQMLAFLAKQLKIPTVDLSRVHIEPQHVELLPEVHARRLRALVIGQVGTTVRVAMSDPADLAAQEKVYDLLNNYDVDLVIASEKQLLAAFDRHYRRTKEITSFAEQLHAEHQTNVGNAFSLTEDTAGADSEEITVVKLINSVFEDAVQVGASDIHIEPDENVLRIRQRVDGVLNETIINERHIANALVLRIKLMCNLDISEKRLPQDGRFNIKVNGRSIDVRVSTMPVQDGEAVVMRLLDQSAGILSLDDIGMDKEILARFRRQLKRPHGMILVTGPTGSGKTTTLYGALTELNSPGKKLLTAEDPVEYRLSRVNQVQVNTKVGLTFSSILRTFLRQDPDIILVGEMRDQETVDIGLRAAMTGHLVLSTLHTNNAVDSVLRLIDMGAQGYLVATSVRAILAQRLIRRICPDCKAEYTLSDEHRIWLRSRYPEYENITYYHGIGCQSCNFMGYRGRIGVFELLELNNELMDALRGGDSVVFSQKARSMPGYELLSLQALKMAKNSITSIEEVIVLGEGEQSDSAEGEQKPIALVHSTVPQSAVSQNTVLQNTMSQQTRTSVQQVASQRPAVAQTGQTIRPMSLGQPARPIPAQPVKPMPMGQPPRPGFTPPSKPLPTTGQPLKLAPEPAQAPRSSPALSLDR